MKRSKLTILGILISAGASAHSAVEPLEQATYEATRLCGLVDQISLQSCSLDLGRTKDHFAARRALGKMLKLRDELLLPCAGAQSLDQCMMKVDWLMMRGFNRALDEEQADQTRSLPRSDTRR